MDKAIVQRFLCIWWSAHPIILLKKTKQNILLCIPLFYLSTKIISIDWKCNPNGKIDIILWDRPWVCEKMWCREISEQHSLYSRISLQRSLLKTQFTSSLILPVGWKIMTLVFDALMASLFAQSQTPSLWTSLFT